MAHAVHTVLIDDERVIVNRFDFAPGDETGAHVHGYPYVIVPLTDGMLRVVMDDGTEVMAPLTMGLPYSRPRGVSHNVFNGGDAPLSFLEIEIKP
ncbi:MAG: cupin domain-containing protein [Gemmobacter sp.]